LAGAAPETGTGWHACRDTTRSAPRSFGCSQTPRGSSSSYGGGLRRVHIFERAGGVDIFGAQVVWELVAEKIERGFDAGIEVDCRFPAECRGDAPGVAGIAADVDAFAVLGKRAQRRDGSSGRLADRLGDARKRQRFRPADVEAARFGSARGARDEK